MAIPVFLRSQGPLERGRSLSVSRSVAPLMFGLVKPARVGNYITAYRQLASHRLVDPHQLSSLNIMQELLFHNRRILDHSTLPLFRPI